MNSHETSKTHRKKKYKLSTLEEIALEEIKRIQKAIKPKSFRETKRAKS